MLKFNLAGKQALNAVKARDGFKLKVLDLAPGGQVIAHLRFEISNAPLLLRLHVLKMSAAGNIGADGRPRQREHSQRHADLAGIFPERIEHLGHEGTLSTVDRIAEGFNLVLSDLWFAFVF